MGNNLIDLQKIWYPDKYETTYIYTYPTFNKELATMISKSGYVKEFKIKYHKSLRFLENLKRNCVEQSSLFECLKDAEGLHAIKLKGKKNIREAAILYCCFQEKSAEDYEESKRIAKARRNKLDC